MVPITTIFFFFLDVFCFLYGPSISHNSLSATSVPGFNFVHPESSNFQVLLIGYSL
ncbi:hypothetical protein ES332_D10G261200v1 [Gossypium tomentosum]|uniref:Uncharacterized protein n=1 Tax=Gossypium tomentosum TaxID=34277 RepID=A0A5D2J8T3_GOSTO|nr:hypothetical protein ES332_D10G261200v1 [Gossypium tomentosum]TYH51269.1 hypothetical protein ES332_D10G261200v1 [Gossypium tomentosum]